MSKHTPTPWGIGPYGEVFQDKGEFYGLRDRVELTGFSLTTGAANPEAVANTEHIVRCVNSHDALVQALRDTLDFYERHSNRWDGINGRHPHEVVEQARAALAAAGAPQ